MAKVVRVDDFNKLEETLTKLEKEGYTHFNVLEKYDMAKMIRPSLRAEPYLLVMATGKIVSVKSKVSKKIK